MKNDGILGGQYSVDSRRIGFASICKGILKCKYGGESFHDILSRQVENNIVRIEFSRGNAVELTQQFKPQYTYLLIALQITLSLTLSGDFSELRLLF